MRIGANQGVWVGEPGAIFLLGENDFGEVFEIYLMADAGVRRDDLEIVECFLAPAEESVALDVAKEFDLGIECERTGGAELVDLNRVVNDEIGGQKRIDFFWIAAEIAHGFAHGCEVHDCGDAGEILQEDARGHEGDFVRRGYRGIPGCEGAHVGGLDEAAILEAKQVFEEDLQGKREARDVADAGAFERVEAKYLEFGIAGLQRRARCEGVF